MKLFSIAFLFLALGSTARAVDSRCLQVMQKGYLGGTLGYGNEVEVDLYRPYQNLLFLSDGYGSFFGDNRSGVYEGALPLGQTVANAFRYKKVVSGDKIVSEHVRSGNHTQMNIDNLQPLPFEDNSMDFIGMRKGLCLCCNNNKTMCAGVNAKQEASRRLFEEVIRVLDLENPDSLAVLHGQEFSKAKVVEMWKRVAGALEDKYPNVQFIFGFAPPGWGFHHGRHGPYDEPEYDESSSSTTELEFNSLFILPKASHLEIDIRI